MALSFDGSTKVISISGSTVLDVKDLWSRWCDWLGVSDNSKFPPAMKQVGGDSIDQTAGTSIPAYIYLLNGWKLKPQESNHTLTVKGGVLLVEGGGDPFNDTIGNFRVRVNYQQPVQAITVATGGGSAISASEIASAVRSELTPELSHMMALQNGLTASQLNVLLELYQIFGLDPTKPLYVSDTQRTVGTIVQSISETTNLTTVQRTS